MLMRAPGMHQVCHIKRVLVVLCLPVISALQVLLVVFWSIFFCLFLWLFSAVGLSGLRVSHHPDPYQKTPQVTQATRVAPTLVVYWTSKHQVFCHFFSTVAVKTVKTLGASVWYCVGRLPEMENVENLECAAEPPLYTWFATGTLLFTHSCYTRLIMIKILSWFLLHSYMLLIFWALIY